ncbi:unnamed protein product [Schistosoma mattheei]|uniref:SH2 domain-containing protein n=1 Tax=Schistosoma mattheei TaxID=31246 RepID=A0A3P8B955_9TREM|nr:unnamed protein product [Schistosoma mattheei]
MAVKTFQDTHKNQMFLSTVSNNVRAMSIPGSIMSTSSLLTEILNARNRDNSLNQPPWFQDMLPREITFELLAREEVGSSVFRNSVTHPVCCALFIRVPNNDNPLEITHYSIQKLSRGVRFKGLNKEWPSLQAFVTHLISIPDMLPCPLKLPQYTTNPIFTSLIFN